MSDIDKIKERRAELAKMREAIDAEERELSIAERVLVRLHRHAPAPLPAVPTIEQAASKLQNRSTSTESLIERALRECATVWYTSAEVRVDVSRLKGKDVPMTTIGPTLTAMKRNGTIVRDGNKVALAERATANGAHLVAAHDVSSDTSVAANE